MKFIDDLYNLYRDHLTGDDEDAVALVLGVLQEQDREDMLRLIEGMEEEEVFHMLSVFLIEMMRLKMAAEGLEGSAMDTDPTSDTFH